MLPKIQSVLYLLTGTRSLYYRKRNKCFLKNLNTGIKIRRDRLTWNWEKCWRSKLFPKYVIRKDSFWAVYFHSAKRIGAKLAKRYFSVCNKARTLGNYQYSKGKKTCTSSFALRYHRNSVEKITAAQISVIHLLQHLCFAIYFR